MEKRWDAYFGAGYDYDDAVRLAKIWNSKDEIGTVKAEAGRRLLAGEALPFKPSPDNVADAKETRQVDAFFAAGYDYDDAAKLAQLWKTDDAYGAKVLAGKKLLAGEALPFEPTPGPDMADPTVQRQVEAFFAAGYDYDDAAELAKLWKLAEPYEAKVEGGKRLLAGDELPIKPDPANVAIAKEAERANAFFDAGYDYDDAVKLAKLWKMEPFEAKVEGGKRLLAGDELPIRP